MASKGDYYDMNSDTGIASADTILFGRLYTAEK